MRIILIIIIKYARVQHATVCHHLVSQCSCFEKSAAFASVALAALREKLVLVLVLWQDYQPSFSFL